LSINFLNLTL